MPTEELSATGPARTELALLGERHGPLMLFLAGGCGDGSSPLCLRRGELQRRDGLHFVTLPVTPLS